MEQQYCQSCGMPLRESGEDYGSNADGSKNNDYCSYCYKEGEFTFNTTMEEMIEISVPGMTESSPEMTEDKARAMMQEFFPTMKRWKK